MTKIIVTIVFFLSIGIHIAWAWDFCVPNEDDIMLYYNVVDEDEGSCEVGSSSTGATRTSGTLTRFTRSWA